LPHIARFFIPAPTPEKIPHRLKPSDPGSIVERLKPCPSRVALPS
jgi:hypothetical protein